MAVPDNPRFDLSQIGEADRHNLCATFLDAVQRFFDDPANREHFEHWQQEQNQTRIVNAVKI